MNNHIGAFLVNLLSAAVWATLAIIWTRFSPVFLRRHQRLSVLVITFLAAGGAAFNATTLYLAVKGIVPIGAAATLTIIASVVVPAFFMREVYKFWRAGLRGTDETIQRGLNYAQALRLCKSQLSFLGTGAAKLTRDPEFERALLRCRPDVPVRFLLASPAGDNLRKAARRAGKTEDMYREILLKSLRALEELKSGRGINIEVRFYTDPPAWRLMFIDKKICLVSYNLFGEGDGSQLPQLHIVKAPEDRREVDSFYYPFEIYFDQLWRKSKAWNFESFL